MNLIKIKRKVVVTPATDAVTEEREVEISFPYFAKWTDGDYQHYYKCISEKWVFCVTIKSVDINRYEIIYNKNPKEYTVTSWFFDNAVEKGTEISEEEFNEAYQAAKNVIETEFNKEPVTL